MSERYGRQEGVQRETGNHQPLGPDIDAEGRRMDGPREDGPRRVGAVREEHEPRGEGHGPREAPRGGEAHRGGNDRRRRGDAVCQE
jgi:hypothetical protein